MMSVAGVDTRNHQMIRVLDNVDNVDDVDDDQVENKVFRVLEVTSFCHNFLPAVVGVVGSCRRLQDLQE